MQHRGIARVVAGALLIGLGIMLPLSAHAEDIVVRISVKIILDQSGNPPPGEWTGASPWDEVMEMANAGNERFGRGYRFEYELDGEVSGHSEYYEITESPVNEMCQLQLDAMASPDEFLWRTDAMNVYIVKYSRGTAEDPVCNGWAFGPDEPGGTSCDDQVQRGFVVMCSEAPTGVGMIHEFGHFFGLRHTWIDDLVADTPQDANPNQCLLEDPDTPEVERCLVDGNSNVECCCGTKTLLTLAQAAQDGWTEEEIELMLNNVMSYHCDNADDFTLSEGQLDRLTDNAREFYPAIGTGVTYFVDVDGRSFPPDSGYSDDPFPTICEGIAAADNTGGDIVLIRGGTYTEALSLTKPVTLRANQGVVRIAP